MKNMDNVAAALAHIISGAFGGAVIGSAIGGDTMPVVGAIAGATFMLYYALFAQRQKKTR